MSVGGAAASASPRVRRREARAAAAYAHATIREGSQSFAAASRLLPPAMRDDVARLYAWCRTADDLIDGQVMGHGELAAGASHGDRASRAAAPEALDGDWASRAAAPDAADRLDWLRRATADALAGHAADPVFAGFGDVARRHGIRAALACDHLDGFAMDVAARTYGTADDLAAYCYGVAGSVGVMMALVMGVAPDERDTLDRASDLGLAFQMTNIARDVVADARAGRVYLPATWLAAEGVAATPAAVADPNNAAAVWRATDRLVGAAEPYYASARVGVARLPFRAAWAIATAGAVYRAIGIRRRRAGPDGLELRVATGPATKLSLVAASAVTAALSIRTGPAEDRSGLWTRPLHG